MTEAHSREQVRIVDGKRVRIDRIAAVNERLRGRRSVGLERDGVFEFKTKRERWVIEPETSGLELEPLLP